MRFVVVTSRWGDAWSEEALVARRVAAVLARAGEVDVLHAAGERGGAVADGAFTVERFRSGGEDRRRREVTAAIAGLPPPDGPPCACAAALGRRVAHETPRLLQEELVRARGGDAPELYRRLASAAYDAVVFVGCDRPATVFGMRRVPPGRRVVVVPVARPGSTLEMDVVRETLARAHRLLVVSDSERRFVEGLADRGERVVTTRLPLRVSELSAATPPVDASETPFVLVVADWTRLGRGSPALRQAGLLARGAPKTAVVLAGRGASGLEPAGARIAAGSGARPDLWRWMSRALAVVEPRADRTFAREALEALLYGVPVLVRDGPGAGREHAEAGGGLWYRTSAELAAAVAAFAENGTGAMLGEQGRAYAEREYGDADRFRERVLAACLD